ncbi:MAG: hypothetical protein EOO43_14075 [Flavobacterium sp.]|nr:MAG: hypothetical protein EOO43_14075 [Flavobacterium sp.]
MIAIYRRETVNATCGTHPCYFCHDSTKFIVHDTDIYVDRQKNELLGMSEIWIPNHSRTKVFAAPDLIIHYINVHDYYPPQEFIAAVNDFDLTSDWSGNEAYQKYLEAKFPDFNGW